MSIRKCQPDLEPMHSDAFLRWRNQAGLDMSGSCPGFHSLATYLIYGATVGLLVATRSAGNCSSPEVQVLCLLSCSSARAYYRGRTHSLVERKIHRMPG